MWTERGGFSLLGVLTLAVLVTTVLLSGRWQIEHPLTTTAIARPSDGSAAEKTRAESPPHRRSLQSGYERSVTSEALQKRLGMSQPELIRVLLDWPGVIKLNYKLSLEPRLDGLQQRLSLSDDELKQIVLKAPSVLKCNFAATIGPRITAIQTQLRLGDPALKAFVLQWPMALSRRGLCEITSILTCSVMSACLQQRRKWDGLLRC